MESLGSVVGLWRYPVKSMQGEVVDSTVINEHGVLGDRAYAILDRATGYVASAKHPRKWGPLFACRAAFVESPRLDAPLPPIEITLPDGTVISSTQPGVDQILSRLVDRDVILTTTAPATLTREADRSPLDSLGQDETITPEPMAVAAPEGTFFDYAPLHLLTTATLDRLRALYPVGRFEVPRFRPNLVIAPAANETGFVENEWLGQELTVGREVRLRLIDPCPRCVVTTLAQDDLPHDPGILRTVTQHNAVASVTLAPGVIFSAVAGVYAHIRQSGIVHRGDLIRLVE